MSSARPRARSGLHPAMARYRAAWMGDDPDAVAGLYTPDGARIEVAFAREDRGRPAIALAAAELMDAFHERRLSLEPLMVDEGGWAAEVTWRAVHRGPYRGGPATHRRVEIPGLSIARLEGGLLADERWYFDAVALGRRLGWRVVD
jgi:ketosteroid isomerase-like protein